MTEQAFVYKWTHLPSLKWYVGSRTARGCHPNDGYICSSKIVKPLIQTNPEQWLRTIIATGTKDEMLVLEDIILETMDAVKDDRSYNLHISNKKFNRTGIPSWNSGLAGKGDPRCQQDSYQSNRKGKASWSAGLAGKGDPRCQQDSYQSNRKGKPAWNSGKPGYKISVPVSQETRDNLSKALKGKPKPKLSCVFCRKVSTVPNLARHHKQCGF